MKSILRLSTALAVTLGSITLPTIVYADNTNSLTMGTVDAGSLIGKNVVDAKGDKIGEIDSVMVDASGKVKAVVLDVSGWLQSEKLVSMSWRDLTVTGDHIITSKMTVEEAKSARAYTYADENYRRKVLTEDGQVFADTNNVDVTTSSGGDGTIGTPVMNADGSINVSQLMGLNILNGDGDKLGDIGEVIITSDGGLQGVVVDVGGFVGIGTHPVLLNWKDIKISGTGDDVKAIVNTTKDNLKSLPEYKANAVN